MTKARLDGLLLLVFGSVFFVLVGAGAENALPFSMVDFKGVYFGSRCLMHHCDPYQESDLQHFYQAQGVAESPDGSQAFPIQLHIVTLYVNLPTGFLLTVPFAMLPWGPAHLLWMLAIGASFLLAAYLMWSLGARDAPVLSGGLICLFVMGSELLLEFGNTAGISVSLCVIAVWCLLKERFVPAGILCFALSLAVKPHVAGLIWLYFLLAGGLYRKRAWQILAVTVVLGLPAVLWVSAVAPHWPAELQANLHTISAHGAMNDPGPTSVEPQFNGAISVSLQTVFSVFRDDPRFYNPVTYLICVPLLLVWMAVTLRSPAARSQAWLALAAIAALSMLPIYHRQHDSRLLLLTFPASAMLWAEGGAIGWIALLVNLAGAIFTGDTPILLLGRLAQSLHVSTANLTGELLTVALGRTAPIAILAMGVFYLWIYVRRCSAREPVRAAAA